MRYGNEVLVTATAFLGFASAISSGFLPGPIVHKPGRTKATQITKRQLPEEPVDVQQLTSPNGANITYKEPGKSGVCETTPGVNSYSGFINLGPDVHSFVR